MRSSINNLKNKKQENTQKCEPQQVNITDLVKPVEFEVAYNQLKNQYANDNHKTLLKFGEGDVKIIRLSKEKVYINDGVPEDIQEIFVNFNLAKFCIDFYLSEWIYTIFKDMSYDGLYFNLIGISSYLPDPKYQKFIVDETKEQLNSKDTNGPGVFKTKGTYFEKNLAVCQYKDYQNFIKRREEEVSSHSTDSKNTCGPKLILFCLREHVDGNKILKESMARDGHQAVTLYLESIETVREIGNCWILLTLKGKDDYYLYTGTNENQKLWLTEFKDICSGSGANKKLAMSQDSLDRFDDNVQSMTSKFLQESETTAANNRKKDRQKILILVPEIRKQIRRKATPDTCLFKPGYFEGAEIRDIDVRRDVEQFSKRNLVRLTATRFQTGLYIECENKEIKKNKVITPEPFFITLFLIHLHDGRRISEEFVWNPNSSETDAMLPDVLFLNKWIQKTQLSQVNTSDSITPNKLMTFPDHLLKTTKSFLLRVAYPLESVGLVFKVEKVFSGSMSSVIDKYSKHGGILKSDSQELSLRDGDLKAGQQVHKTMSIYCKNIGHYRMPFGWGACRLSTNLERKAVKLFKYEGNKISDEELIKQVQGVLLSQNSDGSSSSSKSNSIPAFIEFQVEEVDYKKEQLNSNIVNPEYVCKLNAHPDISECCKEVREFINHPIQKANQNSNSNIQSQKSNNLSNQNDSNSISSGSVHNVSMHDYSDDNSPGERTPPPGCDFMSLSALNQSDSSTNHNLENHFDTSIDSNLLLSKNIISWEDLVSPYLEFTHTLYVYPRQLNFSNQNQFSRARNLSCFIELRDCDKIESIPLRVIYSRPTNKQPAFDTWTNLAITYHESSPVFNEEIKICLPVKLHSKHHLLFRFYHVSVDTASNQSAREKASNKKPLETPVGFAWLPLLDEKLNLRKSLIELPIAVNLVDDYLSSVQAATTNIQWIDNRKSIFRVVLCPFSTIYTQDALLHEFFRICGEKLSYLYLERTNSVTENGDVGTKVIGSVPTSIISVPADELAIKNAIKTIIGISTSTLIRFLGPIFNQLIQIVVVSITTDNSEISKIALNVMFNLANNTLENSVKEHISTRSGKRNTKILKSFIKYSFDADKFFTPSTETLNGQSKMKKITKNKPVHECIVQTIVEMLRPPFRDTSTTKPLLSNSFIFYSIIIKSMIQSVSNKAKLQSSNERSGEKLFDSSFMDMLEQMIHLIITNILDLVKSGISHESTQQMNSGPGYAVDSRRATIGSNFGDMFSSTNNNAGNMNQSNMGNSVHGGGGGNKTGSGSEMAANRALARFLSRLLNVIDRGFVFNRIHQYMRIINERINQYVPEREELGKMKFEFLEIIINHEHYIPLNLLNPQFTLEKGSSTTNTTSGTCPELTLSESYCKQHYLAGLLLQQIHQQMNDVYFDSNTRRMPILALRNLLSKHTIDDRYRSIPAFQSRISALYLPLLSIVLENKTSLCLPSHLTKTQMTTDATSNIIDMGSSRPMSTCSSMTDTLSLRSGLSGPGGFNGQSESGSVYGLSNGNMIPGAGAMSRPPSAAVSTRSSAAYLDEKGKVDQHFLNQIAGLNDSGEMRIRPGRRHNNTNSTDSSDTASIHSTTTIIGIDELNEDANTPVGSNTPQQYISKTGSMSRPPNITSNHSLGKKTGLQISSIIRRANTSSNIMSTSNASGGTPTTAAAFHHQQTRSVYNRQPEPRSKKILNDKTQRDVFLCLIHILGTVSYEDLKLTMSKLTVQDRIELLKLLNYTVVHFKYSGRKVINNLESISRSGFSAIGSSSIQLRSMAGSRSIDVPDNKSINQQSDDKATLDGNLSVEIGLVILEIISAICSVFKQEILSYSPDHALFQHIIELYMTILNMNSSETVLCHTFVSLRVFITNFATVLFSSCNNTICDLSLQTLRFCDCSIGTVRAEACGFLYRMMRVSFDTDGIKAFNRVHLQMIVAVSKLDRVVGPSFEKSLRFLKALAESEAQKLFGSSSSSTTASSASSNTTSSTKKPPAPLPPTIKPKPSSVSLTAKNNRAFRQFFEDVVDLTDRIRTVLMATMHMNEHKDDPEMLVDLQYSLAKSYSSNPALRRTWLEKIYNVHKSNNCRAEMAICKAHIAAMVTEYLRKKENYPLGSNSFKNISPNIPIEEGFMKDDTTQLEVHYRKEEVVTMLREVAIEFDHASLWEVNRHVYKLLIPIYEASRDYESLADSYHHLSDGYQKVLKAESTSNQRLIATYFRVVLYGKPFDNLAGKVFVYRMAGGTQFCGAYETLQKLFEKKYGVTRVNMLQDNYVDRDSLNPNMASIQITHLEPYFDEQEQLQRYSVFEKHYDVSKFMFETPFVRTRENETNITPKQTDDLRAQWKRRTILTIESSFPHLKRRLEVISTKEIDFSPIERAIDELKAKNRQLNIHRVLDGIECLGPATRVGSSTSNNASITKASGGSTTTTSGGNSKDGGNILMDMHLMGALLPQVNQGPMAYARVFLDKSNIEQFNTEQIRLLKIEFMIFLTQCHHLLSNYYQLMTQVHEPKYEAMNSALDSYRIELIDLIKEEISFNEERRVISSSNLVEAVYSNLMNRSGITCDYGTKSSTK